MIRGMAERLAERLKENKSDLEGWLRLISSYAALKETDKAEDAAAAARRQLASDAKALEQIDALAQRLGLAARIRPSSQSHSPWSSNDESGFVVRRYASVSALDMPCAGGHVQFDMK